MNPHPALGTHPSRTPKPARERASERWFARRQRTTADRVEDCQLFGYGAALGVVFFGPTWLAIGIALGSWVVPALAGAWIATRRPRLHSRPRYRSALIELHLRRDLP